MLRPWQMFSCDALKGDGVEEAPINRADDICECSERLLFVVSARTVYGCFQMVLVHKNLPLKIGSCQVKQFGILVIRKGAMLCGSCPILWSPLSLSATCKQQQQHQKQRRQSVEGCSDTNSSSDYHYGGYQTHKQQSTAVKDLAQADESAQMIGVYNGIKSQRETRTYDCKDFCSTAFWHPMYVKAKTTMLKYSHSLHKWEAILENFIPHCRTSLLATRTNDGEVDSDKKQPQRNNIEDHPHFFWQSQQKESDA